MERGIYIAASGMLAQEARQDTIANNLANADTVGFKDDETVDQSFGNMLLTNLQNGQTEGNMSLGTKVAETVTNFSQGSLRSTDSSWNIALQGDGFFAYQTPNGVEYSRDGELQTDANGFITDTQGNYLLGVGGQPINIGTKDDEPLIQANGQVFDNSNNLVGQVAVVQLNVSKATKVGDNYWQNGAGQKIGTPVGTEIRQGYLENSTVNTVSEMVDMINVMRSYESSQKAISSLDDTLDKAVNSVGVVQ